MQEESPFGRVTPPQPVYSAQGQKGRPTAKSKAEKAPSHMAPKKKGENRRNQKQRHEKRSNKKMIAAIVGGGIIAVYAAGVVTFSNLYYPNTTVAGVDVSLSTADKASNAIESALKDYELTVEGCGIDWTYKPAAGSFSIDAQAGAKAALNSDNALAWPVNLVQSFIHGNALDVSSGDTVTVTYDKDVFDAELTQAIDSVNEGRSGTFDSAGAYDADAGKFTLEKARSSQRLNADAVIKRATKALESLSPRCTLDNDVYDQLAGGATDEQLKTACDAANELLGVNVNLKLGTDTVATLDGSQLCQWITFDDQLNPTLETDKVEAWVHELATSKLDTTGTQRTYTRPDGKTITISGGNYGWTSDESALVEKIKSAVANKQTGDIDIPTKQTAAKYTGAGQADWGAYVDVDITEQHARFFDANGNLLWESGCITGNTTLGNDTPTGIYTLNSKETNVTLKGKKDPETGEPSYVSHVNYWMAFVGGSVGLHDADWQASSSFSNPEAYKSVGSHGCVNLPPDKAAELFNLVKVGDCVIVHP